MSVASELSRHLNSDHTGRFAQKLRKERGVIGRPMQNSVGQNHIVQTVFATSPHLNVSQFPMSVGIVFAGGRNHMWRIVESSDRCFWPPFANDGRAVSGA